MQSNTQIGDQQKSVDLKGREIKLYSLPGVGTKLVVNGNEYRIIYSRHTPRFTFSAELLGKYVPKNDQ